ncbi:MAG TPA: C40 family peptidase [Saprospiraceae bacterium]|nr:C40 family peptidase [Saprospiraceae bacterium]
MEYAACQVSIAPLRAQPSDKSEMVSQLLFGETVEIQESKDNWKYVVCAWDGYTGWVDGKQLKRLTPTEFNQYRDHQALNLSLVEGLMAADHFIPVTLGAVLPQYDGLRCQLGEQTYQFSGPVVTPGQQKTNSEWVVKVARRYLHAPYLWGGRSPFGIDCSGFTQMVYKTAGIRLLRDASQQVSQGRLIDFMEECQAGDLAFFDNGKGVVTHVGIILPECHIIHASGEVRVDKLDHFGIFNKEQNRYTHQLRIVKRLLPDEPVAAQVEETEAEVPAMEEELAGQGALFG